MSRVIAALLAVVVFSVSFQAGAQEFPGLLPELYDRLNAGLNTTWPKDPAVPDLPPMPATDDPSMNLNAFLWTHLDDNVYPPRVKDVPEPRTRIVTENDPIEADVCWSIRSPYCRVGGATARGLLSRARRH